MGNRIQASSAMSLRFLFALVRGTGTGITPLAFLAVLASAVTAIGDDVAVTPVISQDGASVSVQIPEGWDNTNVGVSVVRDGVTDAQNQLDFFEFLFTPSNVQIRVAPSTRPVGTWSLSIQKVGAGSRTALFKYAFDSVSNRHRFVLPRRATTPKPNVLGDSTNTTAQQLGQRPNDISELVVTEATNWQTTSNSGDRRQFVAKYDAYPITSCRTIARIFRETATDLATTDTVEDTYQRMKVKFEEFYKQGESRFRSVNPNKDDWQPFLQHLEQVIRERYAADLDNKQFAQWVVSDLAVGFDNLAKIWLDGAIARGVTGGGSSANTMQSGSGGYSAGYDGPARHRKAKIRCHCGRLLF